jgi:hypothetical protein
MKNWINCIKNGKYYELLEKNKWALPLTYEQPI